MSRANTDEGRNRSAAASAARVRFNRLNTCPSCERKGAITRRGLPPDVASACRYCKYAVLWETVLAPKD